MGLFCTKTEEDKFFIGIIRMFDDPFDKACKEAGMRHAVTIVLITQIGENDKYKLCEKITEFFHSDNYRYGQHMLVDAFQEYHVAEDKSESLKLIEMAAECFETMMSQLIAPTKAILSDMDGLEQDYHIITTPIRKGDMFAYTYAFRYELGHEDKESQLPYAQDFSVMLVDTKDMPEQDIAGIGARFREARLRYSNYLIERSKDFETMPNFNIVKPSIDFAKEFVQTLMEGYIAPGCEAQLVSTEYYMALCSTDETANGIQSELMCIRDVAEDL